MLTKTLYEEGYDFTTQITPNLHFAIKPLRNRVSFEVYNTDKTLRTYLTKEEIDELILTLQVVKASVYS